ncbi:hypothetical protein EV189_2355 [Motilibacter rhizosphaerae]|uniref:WXG100 family type VII secretion target n=1 Tax=Motilibacter rhizosphaerae TaxID=598652 RepID=A0A4V2F4A6_9ACTN|nr:WXG100 family type VII secretion target [Motilibacter rhizosphaerae]RZS86937.1 hypothetical protein EV189_2355 [Motilibacter rhizosphaerae]
MIDLSVHGDPGACRAAAQAARTVASTVDDAVSALKQAGSTSTSAWTGEAADGFRAVLGDTRTGLQDLADRILPATTALDTFAGDLDAVKAQFASIRGDALAGGLDVSGDSIAPPSEPAEAADDAEVRAYDAKVDVYNACFDQAESARGKERAAHDALESAMRATDDDGWVENLAQKLGFLPPDSTDPWDRASWVAGRGTWAFGLGSSWMLKQRLQVFQPKNGRLWGPMGRNLDPWQRFTRSFDPTAWHAKPYQAATRDSWATGATWVGRAGLVVTAATAGWDQWQKDADDPSLDTGERVDRTVTKAGFTAGGAWAGGLAGGELGGAIGTAICPGVGTVVGGAVGGLIGGFAGSTAGAWVGDQLNDAADGIGHAAVDLGKGAVDVAKDVGDAITFWD